MDGDEPVDWLTGGRIDEASTHSARCPFARRDNHPRPPRPCRAWTLAWTLAWTPEDHRPKLAHFAIWPRKHHRVESDIEGDRPGTHS